jgi:hypothetical protein
MMSKAKNEASELMPLLGDAPPSLPFVGERVELMRDRLESIKRNYDGMLYFCSRITGIPKDQIAMVNLKQFEVARFHKHEKYVENHAWPVSHYLKMIKRLENEIADLKSSSDA